MNKIKNLLTIGALILSMVIYAQEKNLPSWRHGQNSNYYEYYVGTGVDDNEQKARKIAVLDVKKQISDYIYAEYEIDQNSTTKFNNVENGESVETKVEYVFVATIKQTGKKVTVKGIREVENYSEGNKYYVLYRVPKKDVDIPGKYEDLYIIDNSHKWKSTIFPGWGQMTVGKKKRGAFFLITGGAFAAGIVTSQTLYSVNHTNYSNAIKEGDMKNADIYKSNRDTWGTIRNISVVGFAGIYIFNLIDAYSSKGNKIYSYNDKKMKIYPAATNNSLGLGLCLNLNK